MACLLKLLSFERGQQEFEAVLFVRVLWPSYELDLTGVLVM